MYTCTQRRDGRNHVAARMKLLESAKSVQHFVMIIMINATPARPDVSRSVFQRASMGVSQLPGGVFARSALREHLIKPATRTYRQHYATVLGIGVQRCSAQEPFCVSGSSTASLTRVHSGRVAQFYSTSISLLVTCNDHNTRYRTTVLQHMEHIEYTR